MFSFIQIKAQPKINEDYKKTLQNRTSKIVNTLGITDSSHYKNVQQKLIDQIISVNKIQDESKATIADLKSRQISKEEIDAAIKTEEDKKVAALQTLHKNFIGQISPLLNKEQLEKVKNGMTLGILPVTWNAYQEMLPYLTREQKGKIFIWLVEARELSMDEGTSEKKHDVFGKYKGSINNYLSSQVYDMKKEEVD